MDRDEDEEVMMKTAIVESLKSFGGAAGLEEFFYLKKNEWTPTTQVENDVKESRVELVLKAEDLPADNRDESSMARSLSRVPHAAAAAGHLPL